MDIVLWQAVSQLRRGRLKKADRLRLADVIEKRAEEISAKEMVLSKFASLLSSYVVSDT